MTALCKSFPIPFYLYTQSTMNNCLSHLHLLHDDDITIDVFQRNTHTNDFQHHRTSVSLCVCHWSKNNMKSEVFSVVSLTLSHIRDKIICLFDKAAIYGIYRVQFSHHIQLMLALVIVLWHVSRVHSCGCITMWSKAPMVVGSTLSVFGKRVGLVGWKVLCHVIIIDAIVARLPEQTVQKALMVCRHDNNDACEYRTLWCRWSKLHCG